MTNKEAIKALVETTTYVSAHNLEAVNYAIAVLQKLEEAGIKNPLEDPIKK
ncbi:MAG: hypothetical protein KBS81_03305 [Spirochaetales bacterium]|nr:hypothetical protein [Candidatus Physcosoma equi]